MGKLKFFNEVREALRFLRPGNDSRGTIAMRTPNSLSLANHADLQRSYICNHPAWHIEGIIY